MACSWNVSVGPEASGCQAYYHLCSTTIANKNNYHLYSSLHGVRKQALLPIAAARLLLCFLERYRGNLRPGTYDQETIAQIEVRYS